MTARRRRPATLPPADRARVLRLCRENLRLLHRLVQHDEVGRSGAALDGRELSSPEAVAAYLGPEMADLAQEV